MSDDGDKENRIPAYPFEKRVADHLGNSESLDLRSILPGSIITVNICKYDNGELIRSHLPLELEVIKPATEDTSMEVYASGADLGQNYQAKIHGVFITPYSLATRTDYLDTNALLHISIFDPEYRERLIKQLRETGKLTLGAGEKSLTYPFMFKTHEWPENCRSVEERLKFLDDFYGEKIGWRDLNPENFFVDSFTIETPIKADGTPFNK